MYSAPPAAEYDFPTSPHGFSGAPGILRDEYEEEEEKWTGRYQRPQTTRDRRQRMMRNGENLIDLMVDHFDVD